MLKVFLVEDEFIVREGIKNNIDWAKEGFIFCGEAADGEIAYKLIQSNKPDIIITDIKMPFMNGLELGRLVKKELPESKIIILSGYEEFSFAQEAVNIGVTEYLLKPVSSVELMKVVKRVGQEIIEERRQKENFERYRQQIEANKDYARSRFLEELLEGRLSTAKILEQGKELGLEMGAEYYQVMLFRFNNKNPGKADSKELLELKKKLVDLNSKYENLIFFNRELEGNVLFIMGRSIEEIDGTRIKYIREIKDIFSSYPKLAYFGGIGLPVNRLSRIPESYESAALIFVRRFIVDRSTIISSDELLEYMYEEDGSTITADQLGELDFKRAEDFLRNGEADEIHSFVNEFLKSISPKSQKSLLFMQYFHMNIHSTVISFLKGIGRIQVLEKKPFIEIEEIKEMLIDVQKVKDYMVEIISIAIEQRDLIRTKPYYRIIEQAKEYIMKNYANQDISLNDVAEYVNISSSHFSTIFSRETGSTFIRYLTDLRMNKAKELLKCTDLLCSEISSEVGYRDPHYFSYLFKKEHNCTPLQYRNMN